MARGPGVLATAGWMACAATAAAQVLLARQPVGAPGDYPDPTFITQPPGEHRHLYICLKAGEVRVVRDGVALPAPAIANLPGISASGENGLLGLAFHPEFQTNGFAYVFYTSSNEPVGDRIVRYAFDPRNPEVAEVQSAFTVLVIPRPVNMGHHGGWIGFGPDGYLWISCGDGSGHPQQPSNLGGSILRLDVNSDDFPTDPLRNYGIPSGNPFPIGGPSRPEIVACGLRNPWRCSFDFSLGELWIGDVGHLAREEINLYPAGSGSLTLRNFGWPCVEGNVCSPSTYWPPCPCTDPAFVPPVHHYPHPVGFSVIGGYVYRGSAIPAFRGHYLFGDFNSRKWSFRHAGGAVTDFVERSMELPPAGSGSPLLYTFGEDARGELYYGTNDGSVYRIVPRCPANCDGSSTAPILNVADFTCFLRSFAAGDLYANCDGSTAPPVLGTSDFACFVQEFAAGCP